MQKGKHNIYSKEELLKIIKEGKSAPSDMDEFEREALDGLKMLKEPEILNTLNNEVDEIIVKSNKKEKQKKTIYYLSAAASLLLIVGLIFLFKNELLVKENKTIALAEKPKEENKPSYVNTPVQAEPQETYEAKEPEPKRSPTKETVVLAENKASQKPDQQRNLEQEIITTKNEDAAPAKDQDVERKESIDHLKQSAGAASDEKANKELNDQEQSKNKEINIPATKTVAANSAAFASENRSVAFNAQAPSPVVQQDKKTEESVKADLFYANKAAKSKVAKNYTEPVFIGGDSTFATYAKRNLKISSPTYSGILVVEFLVNKDGTATNIEVLKSITGCDACSRDAIELIKSVKKWQPAIENGKAISAPKKISIQYN